MYSEVNCDTETKYSSYVTPWMLVKRRRHPLRRCA